MAAKKIVYSKELLLGIVSDDINRILQIEHSDPHSVLGAHPASLEGLEGSIIREFHPDASAAEIIMDEERMAMKASDEAQGLFRCFVQGIRPPFNYRVLFRFPDAAEHEVDTRTDSCRLSANRMSTICLRVSTTIFMKNSALT